MGSKAGWWDWGGRCFYRREADGLFLRLHVGGMRILLISNWSMFEILITLSFRGEGFPIHWLRAKPTILLSTWKYFRTWANKDCKYTHLGLLFWALSFYHILGGHRACLSCSALKLSVDHISPLPLLPSSRDPPTNLPYNGHRYRHELPHCTWLAIKGPIIEGRRKKGPKTPNKIIMI